MHLSKTALALFAAASMVAAAPLAAHDSQPTMQAAADALRKRIVINPHITYPNESTVWHTGQKNVNVTWDVPEGAEGYTGRVLLGYLLKNDTSPNEHLYLDPLAQGFNLTDGIVSFDIPCNNTIKSRSTYIVVLMGDSGNKSQNFTIHRDVDSCPNLQSKKKKHTSTISSDVPQATENAED